MTTFSSDLLTPEEERELLTSFWDCKSELVRVLLRHFPTNCGPRGPPLEPWPMAQFIREHCTEDRCEVTAVRRLRDRYVHYKHRLASANIRLAAHVAKRFRHHSPGLRRPAAGGRLRADAGHRPLRREPRHPAGHLRHLVDPPDAADRRRPPEPPREPQPAPPAGTRPAPAGERGPGPRRQAPAQPAGAGLPHRQSASSTSRTSRPPPGPRSASTPSSTTTATSS